MSGHALPGLRPDARDALDRFSFGSPQVHKLLADLAADRARLEDADCVTEAHVKAAARTLATGPVSATPDVLGVDMTRHGFGQAATPRRRRAVPAWLAEPVETYGAIVLAVGVVATAGWVATGYSEAPQVPAPPQMLTPSPMPSSPMPSAPVLPTPVLPTPVPPAPLAQTPVSTPLPYVPALVPVAPVAPEPPATASAEDPALPIPPRKPPAPPIPRNPGPDPAPAPGARKHYLVRATPHGERDLPPRERASDTPATLSAFQSMVRRFSATAAPAPEDNAKPPFPQQRFIGSYVMGPNGTRQFVPDP